MDVIPSAEEANTAGGRELCGLCLKLIELRALTDEPEMGFGPLGRLELFREQVIREVKEILRRLEASE